MAAEVGRKGGSFLTVRPSWPPPWSRAHQLSPPLPYFAVGCLSRSSPSDPRNRVTLHFDSWLVGGGRSSGDCEGFRAACPAALAAVALVPPMRLKVPSTPRCPLVQLGVGWSGRSCGGCFLRGPSVLVELYGMGVRIRCMRCWCGCVPCRPCGAGPAALVSPAVPPSRVRPVRRRFLVRVRPP